MIESINILVYDENDNNNSIINKLSFNTEVKIIDTYSEIEIMNHTNQNNYDIAILFSDNLEKTIMLANKIINTYHKNYLPIYIICSSEWYNDSIIENNKNNNIEIIKKPVNIQALNNKINLIINIIANNNSILQQNKKLEDYILNLEAEKTHNIAEIERQNTVSKHYIQKNDIIKNIIDNCPIGIFRIDIYEKIIYANKQITTNINVNTDNIIGKKFTDIGLPEDIIKQFDIAYKQCITYKKNSNISISVKAKNNTNHYDIKVIPETGITGMITAVLCYIYDNTKLIEEKDINQMIKNDLERIINSIPDCIWKNEYNSKNQLVKSFKSPVITKITGYPIEKFIENPNFILDIIYPDDYNIVLQAIKKVFDYGSIYEEIQFRIVTADNTIRWIKDSAYIEHNNNGSTIVYGIFSDITHKKWAEEALRLKEEHYRTLIEKSGDVVAMLQMNGNIDYISPSVKNLLGYEQNIISGTNITEYLNDDELYKYTNIWNNIINNSITDDLLETKLIDINGNKIDVEITLSKLINTEQITGVLLNIRDINMRKKAEKKIMLFRNAIDRANEGIAILNSKEEFIYVNNAHQKLYGYDAKEFIGNNWKMLYDEKEVLNFKNNIMPVLYLEGYFRGEALGRKKNDEKFFQELSLTLLPDNHLVCIVNDITERKSTEDKLRNYLEELKELNVTKDKYFSIISHDLRSSLGGFIMFCEQLTKNFKSLSLTDIKEMSYDMYNSASNLLKLLNNLVDWSKSQRGIIAFEPDNYNFCDIINSILYLLMPSANAKNIQLDVDMPEEIVFNFDYRMLETVMRNLVSNAIKFTPQNGKISINYKSNDLEHIISVCDNGIGISEDEVGKLFKLGEVHSKPGTENEQGSGIGLVLCKEFIDKHNGKISVKSSIASGSEFSISIPREI